MANVFDSIDELIFKQKSDPEEMALFEKIGKALVLIHNAIKSIKVEFPKIYRVEGSVDIDSLPSVQIENLKDLEKYFTRLEGTFMNLTRAIQAMPAPKIEVPKIEMPKNNPSVDLSPVLGALQDVREAIKNGSSKEAKFPKSISVDNFPVQMTPQPVTNININPLRGKLNASLVSVGTTATALPVSPLANRRSLMIYNPSSTVTVYVGGASVAALGNGQGFPVPPLSYSPAFDAGTQLIVYGIVASGTQNINVLEISNEAIGG